MKLRKSLILIRCWFSHKWEFAGGKWILDKKVSETNQYCSRCKLKQTIHHYHILHDGTQSYGIKELVKEEYV